MLNIKHLYPRKNATYNGFKEIAIYNSDTHVLMGTRKIYWQGNTEAPKYLKMSPMELYLWDLQNK